MKAYDNILIITLFKLIETAKDSNIIIVVLFLRLENERGSYIFVVASFMLNRERDHKTLSVLHCKPIESERDDLIIVPFKPVSYYFSEALKYEHDAHKLIRVIAHL